MMMPATTTTLMMVEEESEQKVIVSCFPSRGSFHPSRGAPAVGVGVVVVVGQQRDTRAAARGHTQV